MTDQVEDKVEVERLFRVVAPDFIAGLVVKNDRVIRAAPILIKLGWLGRSLKWIEIRALMQSWDLKEVKSGEDKWLGIGRGLLDSERQSESC